MSRSDSERIDDIIDAAGFLSRIVEEGQASFRADWKSQLAAERLLQKIGEAAVQLSDEATARFPRVPWAQIRGLRNRVTHEYHKIDQELVWGVLVRDVPSLVSDLSAVPDTMDDGGMMP